MTANSDEEVPVTRYIVVRKSSVFDLENAVSVLIDEDYMPLGGMCIYRTAAQCLIFAQAMLWRQDDTMRRIVDALICNRTRDDYERLQKLGLLHVIDDLRRVLRDSGDDGD